jgi:WD40 repeat protein
MMIIDYCSFAITFLTYCSIRRSFSFIDSFKGSADQTVRLWDLHKRQAIATLKGHLKPVTAVAFESSGKYIASGRN